jgi:hypothetical protein
MGSPLTSAASGGSGVGEGGFDVAVGVGSFLAGSVVEVLGAEGAETHPVKANKSNRPTILAIFVEPI